MVVISHMFDKLESDGIFCFIPAYGVTFGRPWTTYFDTTAVGFLKLSTPGAFLFLRLPVGHNSPYTPETSLGSAHPKKLV